MFVVEYGSGNIKEGESVIITIIPDSFNRVRGIKAPRNLGGERK